jgi:myo-inositol-1(or 4)-monophosphatase
VSTSSSSADTALHEFLRDVAYRTGRLQLERYEDPGEVREKRPKDLVTEVDLLCEEFLISEIEARYPQDAVLSEERGGEIAATGRTWLLDPVDGTVNYSRGNPMFCVCVSIVEAGAVTHAAVAIPKLDEVYHAARGAGAYRNAARIHVSPTGLLEDALVGADVSFGKISAAAPDLPIGEAIQAGWQLRAVGSAGVRGAWVASGHLDVSLGTRNTVWDYAPTALLVSEAGGRVTDLSGAAWELDSDGLVATNGLLHDELLEILNS